MSYAIKRTFHTGFCVGDLDWSIGFFQQVLGFKLVDKAPRDPRNQSFVSGVPGVQVMIAYMDCAGHSLELQDYRGSADRQEYRPRMVDLGHFHVSFVVDDVDAVVAACKSYDAHPDPVAASPGGGPGTQQGQQNSVCRSARRRASRIHDQSQGLAEGGVWAMHLSVGWMRGE